MKLQIDEFKEKLAELQKSRDFDKCYEEVEYLMYHIVENNALGRGIDRALEKLVPNKELRYKAYGEAIQQKLKGDEHSQAEHEFIMSLKFMNEE